MSRRPVERSSKKIGSSTNSTGAWAARRDRICCGRCQTKSHLRWLWTIIGRSTGVKEPRPSDCFFERLIPFPFFWRLIAEEKGNVYADCQVLSRLHHTRSKAYKGRDTRLRKRCGTGPFYLPAA